MRQELTEVKGSYNCDRKELNSGFWAGQDGCAKIMARRLRHEDAGPVCRVMKGLGDVAELKRLLLEGEHEDA
jgi:hypothetical protein